ncbi:MAG TPA: peptidylprolyl isomerase [Capillimicrobium sp.]|jgi:cyclophilin family peptidyl-prolyl cis-trans isomerase
MRRFPAPALAALAAALLAAGCGGDEGSSDTSTAAASTAAQTQPAETQPTTTEGGCEAVEPAAPKEVDLPKPTERLDADATYRVTLATNCGDIVIELDQRESPKTAASFAYLAEERAFDGTPFHRVVPGFVIQGGDPSADGTGGPGFSVVEAPPRGIVYRRGMVAMAKTEIERPGTSGSQFFIVLGGDGSAFQPLYAYAGEVVEGMDIVDRIAEIPTDQLSAPLEPVVIESASLDEQAG